MILLYHKPEGGGAFASHVYHPGCAVDVLDGSGNFAPDEKPGYRHG
ncbi:MAG: hypothetical protein IT165_13955 [Bryobacterales bacterium]|nr:hypothetical protein [Bryobacterales bacterium]